MDYRTFEAKVLRNVGNRNDDDTKALVMQHTNTVLEELLIAWEWPDLQVTLDFNLTVGKNVYNLGAADGTNPGLGLTDFYKDYSISLFDSVRWLPPMKRYPYLQWERDIKPVQGFVQGRPGSYTLIGNTKIEFSCPAAVAYLVRLYYYKKLEPVTLVNGVADPNWTFPLTMLDTVLEFKVTSYTWLSLQDKDMYTLWEGKADKLLTKYIEEAKQQINTLPISRRDRQVIGVPWTDPFVHQMR